MGVKVVRAYYNMMEAPDTVLKLVSYPYYVFLHFYDPMIINIDDKKIITNEHAFIIFTPDAFQEYSLYYGQFRNDYIYFLVDDPDFLKQFNFPLNRAFYLDNPSFAFEHVSFIMWLMTDHISDHSEEISEQMMYIFNQLSDRIIDPTLPQEYTMRSKKRIIDLRTQVMQSPENWTVKKMANSAFLSVSSFTAQYKSLFGVTPGEDLRGIIIDKAKALLINTNLSISEISDMLHYSNPENLIRAFKKQTGLTPIKFRKNQ